MGLLLENFRKKNPNVRIIADLGLIQEKKYSFNKLIVMCNDCNKSFKITKYHQYKKYKCYFCESKKAGHRIGVNFFDEFKNLALAYEIEDGEILKIYKRAQNKLKELIKRCYGKQARYKMWQKLPEPKIADDWRYDFLNFANWLFKNGFPFKNSLNRINPDLGYSAENCELVDNLENSVLNKEFYKSAIVFYYDDCELYLTLKQRARYLGYRDATELKTKHYINVGNRKKGTYLDNQDFLHFKRLSQINRDLVKNKKVKFYGKIKADVFLIRRDDFAKMTRKTTLKLV